MPSPPETPAVGNAAPQMGARLVIEGEKGPEIVALDKSPFIIGRLGDLRLSDGRVSRRHAQIVHDGDGYTAEDLGSSNGTFINEERIEGKAALKTGDVLRVGPSRMAIVLEQLDSKTSDEISTAIRASKGAVHPRTRPGADLTQRVVPVPRAVPQQRSRPTIQTDPRVVQSHDRTLDEVTRAGVLVVSLGNETLQVPIEGRVELDHALSLGGLDVSGPAGTVLFRDGAYWLETRPGRDAVLVNGRPVSGPTLLSPGDQVSIGPVELELQLLA